MIRALALAALLALAPPALAAPAAPAAPVAPVAAKGDEVMAMVRADRWDDAAAAAARYPDTVVAKLVRYFRLMAPGQATAEQVAAFMAENPDWPMQGTLARRRDEALAGEPDDAVARRLCQRDAPGVLAAMMRCLEALGRGGKPAEATAMARRAWSAGPAEAAWEQRFLAEYGDRLGAADQSARFERLIVQDVSRGSEAGRQAEAAIQRQIARLPAAARARAEARLAFRRDDPQASRLAAALSEAERADPGLVLDQAAWLRRSGQDDAARALWTGAAVAAEKAAGDRRAAFWSERNIMVRRHLRLGDAAAAYAIAAGHAQTGGESAADAEFLAGFIALRRMADPTRALVHFRKLQSLSPAAITQGRAAYWIGRGEEAAGHSDAARAAYADAARWANTFYGQLGALRSGDTAGSLAKRIAGAEDPAIDAGRMVDWSGRELARAAAWLSGWGETRRAQTFMLRLEEVAPDPADKALVARLALGFGMPETAVALARRAGREGVILLDTGWPQPVNPPPGTMPEPALTLGIIRQESSFDSATISPVGARGLMQLMPATAQQVARKIGVTGSIPALVLDPAYNMRLGTAYLRDLLLQYNDAVPLAVAAYNAGPGRVADWLATNGDPRAASVDVLDWIELIPFGETRNYVQRVIENQVIYRAKRGETKPHPLAAWLR